MSNTEYTLRPEGKPIASYKDLEDLRAKIVRLREALERIADVTERWPDGLASQVNEIARAALKETT